MVLTVQMLYPLEFIGFMIRMNLPKPYAPLEYRGPFKSIKTKIPGVHFSENFKHSAKIADKITVCRSMTHGEAAHERGTCRS